MTPPSSVGEFHLGLALDGECNDWKTIDAALDHLVSNRIAAGETVIVHDVTSWFSTKIALLWVVGKGYRVDYTARHIHNRNHTPLATFWDIHVAKPMDALAAFYCTKTNNTTFINATKQIRECAAAIQEHGIPTRLIPCRKLPQLSPSPYVSTQSGQIRKYGDSYRIGHFYAPEATKENARLWLWNSVEPFSQNFGDYHLEEFRVDPEGWWHFNLRRDYLD